MAEKVTMGNVIIRREDQSAPGEHWADREIKKAAEEIDEGRYVEDPDPERLQALHHLGLALGLGNEPAARGMKPTLDDFQRTLEIDKLGRHPRVMEALERLKQEVYEPRDPGELLEHNFALRELTEASTKAQRWDGQGRWMGRENEEMRYGQLLTPAQFHDRLCRVIGPERVLLSPHCVLPHPGARSGRVGLYAPNPRWKGAKQSFTPSKKVDAESLSDEGRRVLAKAQRLRLAGRNNEADKAFDLAAEMAQAATELFMQEQADAAIAEIELLRVGTLQWPLGTEWMIMRFSEYGAVWNARYLGWRTALLTMIRCSAISEEEAHAAFPVPSGPAAEWYLEQLQNLRNLRAGAA